LAELRGKFTIEGKKGQETFCVCGGKRGGTAQAFFLQKRQGRGQQKKTSLKGKEGR